MGSGPWKARVLAMVLPLLTDNFGKVLLPLPTLVYSSVDRVKNSIHFMGLL